MSHKSVVQLIHDSAVSLSDDIQFGYGRRSDFNLTDKKREVFFWLQPLTSTPSFTTNNNTEGFQKTWNCILLVLAKDQTDSDEKQFKPIMDRTDELLDKFIHRLNDWSMKATDTVGAVTLRNFQQNPIIKGDADIFTGWVLSFQITTSDDFEYCTPENVVLYGTN